MFKSIELLKARQDKRDAFTAYIQKTGTREAYMSLKALCVTLAERDSKVSAPTKPAKPAKAPKVKVSKGFLGLGDKVGKETIQGVETVAGKQVAYKINGQWFKLA